MLERKPAEDIVAQEGEHTEQHDRDGKRHDNRPLALGEAQRREMVFGLVDPGALDELQVVVKGDDVVQHGKGHERVVPGGRSGEEQVELAEEARKGRNARKAEHGHGERDGECRVLLAEAAQGVERLFAVVADDAENEEREVVRECVDEQVVDDGRAGHLDGPEERNHDIAGLRDGTVRHEAAEACLLEGSQVTDKERGACKQCNERGDLFLNRSERAVNENYEECDSGCLPQNFVFSAMVFTFSSDFSIACFVHSRNHISHSVISGFPQVVRSRIS